MGTNRQRISRIINMNTQIAVEDIRHDAVRGLLGACFAYCRLTSSSASVRKIAAQRATRTHSIAIYTTTYHTVSTPTVPTPPTCTDAQKSEPTMEVDDKQPVAGPSNPVHHEDPTVSVRDRVLQ